MTSASNILAIDLGLRTGFAFFVDGELTQYRSTHFPTVTALKGSVWGILKSYEELQHIVVEGDVHLAEIWEKAAAKQSISHERVSPETWREVLLTPTERESSKTAKNAADKRAREIIEQSSAPNPTGDMMSDVAEAILIGVWATLERDLE